MSGPAEDAPRPSPAPPLGTEGYAAEADRLVLQYEGLPFARVLPRYAPFLPEPPGPVADIGAGTGRDAAGFAALGHRVVAVEPTAELRAHGRRLHPSARIEWMDDGLPHLPRLVGRGARFGMVLLSAVWMHLDAAERRAAMPVLAGLLASGGALLMSLRHGPVPPGRRMFEVTSAETVALAEAAGLTTGLREDAVRDGLGRGEVSWTWIAFRAP